MKEKVIIKCQECGEDFIKKYKIHIFCSKRCSSTHFAKIRTGKDKFTADCLQCGKEFKQSQKQRFCSNSCSATYNNPRKKRKDYTISKDGIRKDRPKCRKCSVPLKKFTSVYCGNQCEVAYKNEKYTEKILKGECKNRRKIKEYFYRVKGEKCERCGIGGEWCGEKLTLHLDHIDGNSDNNNLENLRVLCPNCHTQTHNYGAKNIGVVSTRSTYSKNYYKNKVKNRRSP